MKRIFIEMNKLRRKLKKNNWKTAVDNKNYIVKRQYR